ncbi:GNAT family N-acetyltransferase [Salipaludibacillus sp. HK11]|uniref:GNAT family N-acetyltransferase n=1 Tax=Salipaludibacillus sp. HK11 TaxID=3394320 RepID=UPI0039FC4810
MNWNKGNFMVSDDISLIDLDTVFYLLSNTYWAADRKKEIIEKSMKNSISFGLYDNQKQIGFARVVTDKAVFSWLLDVVINENYRRNGLGYWLMECILQHPEIKYTRFALATEDAHDFYKKFKFKERESMARGLVID